MNTLSSENNNVGLNKATRRARCMRVPLSNLTNNQTTTTTAVVKKPKTVNVPSRLANITDVEPYTQDIIDYMIVREQELEIYPNYMHTQPDLKSVMRSILVDWLLQACAKFKLNDETLYYSIQYVDRFLSKQKIDRANLQLVGICSIFIASKFEEIMVPTMSDLCYITEDTYTPNELVRMEEKMLKVLDYNLSYPTSIQFLRYIVKTLSCSRQQYYYAKFLCELMAVSYSALQWKPSEIAVSSLDILNKASTFVPVLQQMSFLIEPASIEECKQFMVKVIVNDELSQFSTVFSKFESVHGKLKSLLL